MQQSLAGQRFRNVADIKMDRQFIVSCLNVFFRKRIEIYSEGGRK